MKTNNTVDRLPEGKAFEKPQAVFENDKEIVEWARCVITKLDPTTPPDEPDFQLVCFLAASSIVGPEDNWRMAYSGSRAAESPENFRPKANRFPFYPPSVGDVRARRKNQTHLIMSTIKNGEIGTLDTMGQMVWQEAEDLQYYRDIHGNAEGTQERRDYLLDCIERNLDDYAGTLDHAIQFLWKRPHDLGGDILSLLSIDGKIVLLRNLIMERSNEIPTSRRLDYLARFEDDLERYVQVEQLRNKVLCRYLLDPQGTWLRKLVDADDWTVAAWFQLDESMSCEHEGYVRLRASPRG